MIPDIEGFLNKCISQIKKDVLGGSTADQIHPMIDKMVAVSSLEKQVKADIHRLKQMMEEQ